jgi:hypothetical protein
MLNTKDLIHLFMPSLLMPSSLPSRKRDRACTIYIILYYYNAKHMTCIQTCSGFAPKRLREIPTEIFMRLRTGSDFPIYFGWCCSSLPGKAFPRTGMHKETSKWNVPSMYARVCVCVCVCACAHTYERACMSS